MHGVGVNGVIQRYAHKKAGSLFMYMHRLSACMERVYMMRFLLYSFICMNIAVMASVDVKQEHAIPEVKAFLDVIACLEGTYDSGYNVRFGGSRFYTFADHPRGLSCATVRGESLYSSVAGRYQISEREWDTIKAHLSLHSFKPICQDYAMIYILHYAKVLPYIKKYQFQKALAAIRPYKQSVDDLLSGKIQRCSIKGLYATFVARAQHYSGKRYVGPRDILSYYLKKPKVRAFLDMIAYAEGTDHKNGYRVCFTGKNCSSLYKHPATVVCASSRGKQLCSSAAGRYQLLRDSWRIMAWRIAAPDFSEQQQDRATVQILLDMKVIDPLLYDDFETAVERANGKWASLPGGPHKQPMCSLSSLQAVYERKLAYYTKNNYK